MPKKDGGQDRLTLAQESYISVLWLAESRFKVKENSQPVLAVTGAWFEMHLGVIWNTYHRRLMTELQALNWIHITRRNGCIWYSLTDLARFAKQDHNNHAMKNASVQYAEIPF